MPHRIPIVRRHIEQMIMMLKLVPLNHYTSGQVAAYESILRMLQDKKLDDVSKWLADRGRDG